ncbi:MAG: acetyl-CoA C-acyltransferase [Solirubrobacteraceae bacterium]
MSGPRSVIVDAVRSPVGRAHKGSLVDVRPDDLAGAVVRALLDRNPAAEEAGIDELVCGCAYPWGEQGYNVGRQVALLAGLPDTTPAFTVARACASSLQALRSADHAVRAGEGDVYIVSGVESVSRVGRDRHLATPNPRLDSEQDGELIADVFMPMLETAERVAERYGISREEMDAYGQRSQERAVAAQRDGSFAREIVPVVRADGETVTADDGPRPGSTIAGLAALSPVLGEGGSVTAGNSSPLNDGAAALLVMSQERAAELGLRPRARIVASGVSALDPTMMGMGPVEAVRRALAYAGLRLDDMDVIELNEAFAAQVIPVMRELGTDEDDPRLNPRGGAIALGHPFGMTGARIMTTLLNGLEIADGRYGLETMCVGGGQGQAMIVERLA